MLIRRLTTLGLVMGISAALLISALTPEEARECDRSPGMDQRPLTATARSNARPTPGAGVVPASFTAELAATDDLEQASGRCGTTGKTTWSSELSPSVVPAAPPWQGSTAAMNAPAHRQLTHVEAAPDHIAEHASAQQMPPGAWQPEATSIPANAWCPDDSASGHEPSCGRADEGRAEVHPEYSPAAVRPTRQPVVEPVEECLPEQRCIVRDPETACPLLTLTMSGRVQATEISPHELAARRRESNVKRPGPGQARNNLMKGSVPEQGGRPAEGTQLAVSQNPHTGDLLIDAVDVDIIDLLQAVSSYANCEIVHDPQLGGSLSAKISADSVGSALSNLLDPFGYVVQHGEGRSLVITKRETQDAPSRPAASPDAHASHPDLPTIQVGPGQEGQTTLSSTTAQPVIVRLVSEQRPWVAEVPPESAATEPEGVPAPEEVTAQAGQPAEPARDASVAHESLPEVAAETPPPSAADCSVPDLAKSPIEETAAAAREALAHGQINEGLALLAETVVQHPDASAPLLLMMGQIYYSQEDYPAAEFSLRHCLELDEQNATAHDVLGQALLRLGRFEEGQRSLERAKQLVQQK